MEGKRIEINFKGIQSVDKMAHLLVFGYIHDQKDLVSDMIIPSPIYLLCLVYYYINKICGDKHSSLIEVSGENNETITVIKEEDSLGIDENSDKLEILLHSLRSNAPSCAYGYDWIDSMSNKKVTYKIKLVKLSNECQIGISTTDTNFDSFCIVNNTFYAIDEEGDKWCNFDGGTMFEDYDEICSYDIGQGDTVTIELDLIKKTISFYINDKWKGIAFSNIDTGENIKYKLAVKLNNLHDCCTVVDHFLA